MNKIEIQEIISSEIECDYIEVLGDDGAHFEAVIVSDEFLALSKIQRHQLVYKALGDLMQEKIHALSMRTYDKNEWKKIKELK
jgi:acid stress-induced BolA-like protein IbaG/YrbA